MKTISCILIGYLLGSLSPSALLSKVKNTDLRELGTHNLGATNTMLVLGKRYGVFVMLFDIAKAFAAARLAKVLFPAFSVAGLVAGSSAVLGHVYPFYLRFRGGKGLAAFAGMVLAVDPSLFSFLLVLSVLLMLLVNYSAAVPMTAGLLFPILYGLRTQSFLAFAIAAAVSTLIILQHFGNVLKARRGEDIKVREYIKANLFR